MRIDTLARSLLVGAALSLAASGAVAGVAGSRHDLSATGAANQFDGTGDICVFCHTPHGADTTANPPLWNRVLAASGSFTTYDQLGTSTLDGEVLPVGSVSIACLSCHDGTQAMNVMINAPGSGGYDPGVDPTVTANGLAGTWTGPAATATPVGSLNYGGNNIVNIGQDLQNDHPIGVAYAGGACIGTGADCDPAVAASGDPDFNVAQFASINTSPFWWVDVSDATLGGTAVTGTPDAREKTDMILYSRPYTGGTGPSVECGSCHDPHQDVSTSVSFLRIDSAGSDVCLACHIK